MNLVLPQQVYSPDKAINLCFIWVFLTTSALSKYHITKLKKTKKKTKKETPFILPVFIIFFFLSVDFFWKIKNLSTLSTMGVANLT